MSPIEAIVAIQSDLMEAMDQRDVARIEQATKDLARAIGQVRQRGAMVVGTKLKDDVDYALKQTDALRTRVNFLALRNREQLEKLDQLRGVAAPHVYASRRNTPGSRLPA